MPTASYEVSSARFRSRGIRNKVYNRGVTLDVVFQDIKEANFRKYQEEISPKGVGVLFLVDCSRKSEPRDFFSFDS